MLLGGGGGCEVFYSISLGNVLLSPLSFNHEITTLTGLVFWSVFNVLVTGRVSEYREDQCGLRGLQGITTGDTTWDN